MDQLVLRAEQVAQLETGAVVQFRVSHQLAVEAQVARVLLLHVPVVGGLVPALRPGGQVRGVAALEHVVHLAAHAQREIPVELVPLAVQQHEVAVAGDDRGLDPRQRRRPDELAPAAGKLAGSDSAVREGVPALPFGDAHQRGRDVVEIQIRDGEDLFVDGDAITQSFVEVVERRVGYADRKIACSARQFGRIGEDVLEVGIELAAGAGVADRGDVVDEGEVDEGERAVVDLGDGADVPDEVVTLEAEAQP